MMGTTVRPKDKTDDKLIEFYERMAFIREFEIFLEGLFKRGEVFGTIHACIGQEAVAVGVISALSKDDIITGNHRSHGHFIAYGGNAEGLMAEIMGKRRGIVSGRGGSQHLYAGNFYSNGVQGSLVPVAAGMAYAEKIKQTGNIVVCFIGDGTLGQGIVYESMNMASLWGLPVLFVLENNCYAMSTRTEDAVAGSIPERGRAFGITTKRTSSNDVILINREAEQIVNIVRTRSRPYFWIIDTYRQCGHSKGDDTCYRSPGEEALWKEKDPLVIARRSIDRDTCGELSDKVKKDITDMYDRLKNADFSLPEGIKR